MEHDHEERRRMERQSRRSKWILIGFLAVGAFFLLAEHRAHLYGALPYLLLMACVLMHLFHGHGSHGGHDTGRLSARDDVPDTKDLPPAHEHGGNKS